MLQFTEILSDTTGVEAETTLTLPFESRQKARLKMQLDDGRDAALLLPRGKILRSGDVVGTEDGINVRIVAAEESVSTAHTDNSTLLARACYHLGNRHMPLQIGDGWLRYAHDHVLDDMVKSLGLDVQHEHVPFEPESGAYAKSHGHNHAH